MSLGQLLNLLWEWGWVVVVVWQSQIYIPLTQDRTKTSEVQDEILALLQQSYVEQMGLSFLISKMGAMVVTGYIRQALAMI